MYTVHTAVYTSHVKKALQDFNNFRFYVCGFIQHICIAQERCVYRSIPLQAFHVITPFHVIRYYRTCSNPTK